MAAEKIFDNNGKDMMLIDVYFSGGASSVIDMIEKDPNYGEKYQIRFAFTNNEDVSGIAKLIEQGITVIIRDHKKEYAKMHENIIGFNDFLDSDDYVKDWGDFETESGRESFLQNACGRFYNQTLKNNLREHLREEYDKIVYNSLNNKEMIKKYGAADIVCLSGYMRVLSDWILEKKDIQEKIMKIINVHPAKLSIVTNGKVTIDASDKTEEEIEEILGKEYYRVLTGDDTVTDAITQGYDTLYSTIHLVDKTVDGGQICVTSPQVKINLEYAKRIGIEEYAEQVQNIMKELCDSPAYFKALELISEGHMSFDKENNELIIEGTIQKYGGLQMTDKKWEIVIDKIIKDDEGKEKTILKAIQE